MRQLSQIFVCIDLYYWKRKMPFLSQSEFSCYVVVIMINHLYLFSEFEVKTQYGKLLIFITF